MKPDFWDRFEQWTWRLACAVAMWAVLHDLSYISLLLTQLIELINTKK